MENNSQDRKVSLVAKETYSEWCERRSDLLEPIRVALFMNYWSLDPKEIWEVIREVAERKIAKETFDFSGCLPDIVASSPAGSLK